MPPDSYDRTVDFIRKVIEPALLEVNGLSDMTVDIELRRKHSRAPIYEVAVSWRTKTAEEFRQVQLERDRSKVGRMARLRGNVEAVEHQM